ncbi:MAG TPA: helix-turn-helix domain-containing protein [Ktedonobacteraceae bacterium]|nr:helix-turn-helix domain-containing protein [Ktedonobacteraceae bacterium]
MARRNHKSNKENGTGEQQEERSKRQERAERILEVAATLIERWGYSKTTMDDIARAAGVGKGTLYLHWKTKEDLLHALYYRESAKLTKDIEQRIAGDPAGLSLASLMKHAMLATMKNPFMMAILTRDTAMLGEFAQREYGDALTQQNIARFRTLLEALRGQGQLRADISLHDFIYMFEVIAGGFMTVGSFLPEELRVSDERAADLLGDAMQRVFEPRSPADSGGKEAVSQLISNYLEEAADFVREEDKRGIES